MTRISRRRFFIHSAHSTVGVSAGWAALEAGQFRPSPAHAAETQKPLRLCLVSGSLEYKSDESLAAFQQHLEERYPVRCSRAFIRTESDLPGLEHLETSDCLLLFTRRLKIDGVQLNRVKQWCQAGRPIVGVRTASHAFQNWLELDKEVFGGDYQGHYGNTEKCGIRVVEGAQDHPLLRGVRPFVSSGSLYKNPNLAADAKRLLTGTIPGHTEPVAWARLHKQARVFYTSLGHPDDFREPSFLRLLVNAIFWSTQRDLPHDRS